MKKCRNCQFSFEVKESEKAFYQKISPELAGQVFEIPEPNLCPDCRLQNLMLWRGELHLFRRKCEATGRTVLTYYPPEADVVIYSNDVFWGDSWEALDYGKDFDFSRPFFEQFEELTKIVPRYARAVTSCENCDYINCAIWCKDCYLLAGANYNEECYYGNYINHCKSCIDCNFIRNSELCYQCIDCTHCYDLKYSQNCSTCSESYFLQNCRGCSNCFGCVNLVNKQYHFFNDALSRAEYQKKISEFKLGSRKTIDELKKQFEEHRLTFAYQYMIGEKNENVSGHSIYSSKNARHCFDVSDVEDCSYCTWLHQAKSCMDILAWGFSAELCYQAMGVGDSSHRVIFCVDSWGSTDVLYSQHSMYSKNCFGCFSLHKKENCIFNKAYSKHEYEKLAARIISHMQETGEWGEFFPMSSCPLAYNTSVAQDYFPLSKTEVESLGAKWHEKENEFQVPKETHEIPDDIAEIDESICEQVLLCSETGKPYKLIKPELKFYKKNSIPVPTECFDVRHQGRVKRRNPRQLWQRNCDNCNDEIMTSYAAERPEKVFCEKCYLEELY